MSKSKGNELLQDLYDRLTGLWYHKGKYAGQRFPCDEVAKMIVRIKKEYDEEERKDDLRIE